jgi:hypothetical protein
MAKVFFNPNPKIISEKKPKSYSLKRSKIKKKAPKKSDHREVYMNHFGYTLNWEVVCEIPKCGLPYSDIHHIDCRGMGGTSRKYGINDLMALCRKHHDEYGDKKQWKIFLNTVHQKFLKLFKKSTP